MTDKTVDNPFFARIWKTLSSSEPAALRRLRGENLAGLSGRVLEIGAGTGTNFSLYPSTVTEVVAIEPERHLAEVARSAAATAPVPVTVTSDTAEKFSSAEPFDAVVCSLVLCSIDQPDTVLRQLLRCCAREGSCVIWSMSRAVAGGPGCSVLPMPRCGHGCSETATPIGTPNRRSPTAASRLPPLTAKWRCPYGSRCR